MAGLSVSVEDRGGAHGRCTVVVLAGEADVTARELEDVLSEEAGKCPAMLLVEMSQLRFLDSWALHVLLRAARHLQGLGSRAAFVNPRGPVRRVLEITQADRLVPVYESMTGAEGSQPR